MKILGIDYGSQTVGLSLSDPLQTMAFPYGGVANKTALHTIESLIKEEDISEIVLGMPTNLKGKDTPMTKTVREFLTQLQALFSGPIHEQDERLTSQFIDKQLLSLGMKTPQRRQVKDALEAAQILQLWLDKRNAKR